MNSMKSVTVVITACDRLDLLEMTLRSFLKYNTYPIEKFIIRDDSGLQSVWRETMQLLHNLSIVSVMGKEPAFNFYLDPIVRQVGQAKSIDLLMAEVYTPYVFHLEDDWEFDRPGFIEDCFEIIDWENKWGWGKKDDFAQIRVRHHNDGSATQKKPFASGNAYHCTNHLFSFNPHLRRTGLIDKFEGKNETMLGEWVKESGLKTLWLKEGACRHIGGEKTTNRPGTPYHAGVQKA